MSIYHHVNTLVYSVDKKLKAASDGYDVDLQIVDQSFTYNLEIKTPTIYATPAGQLNAEILFRTTDKETVQKEKRVLQDDFLDKLLPNCTSEFEKGYESITNKDPHIHLVELTLYIAGFIENKFPYSDKLEFL